MSLSIISKSGVTSDPFYEVGGALLELDSLAEELGLEPLSVFLVDIGDPYGAPDEEEETSDGEDEEETQESVTPEVAEVTKRLEGLMAKMHAAMAKGDRKAVDRLTKEFQAGQAELAKALGDGLGEGEGDQEVRHDPRQVKKTVDGLIKHLSRNANKAPASKELLQELNLLSSELAKCAKKSEMVAFLPDF